MAKLLNRSTGVVEDVPDAKVAKYLADPNYAQPGAAPAAPAGLREVAPAPVKAAPAAPAEEMVNVISPAGVGGTIPKAQLKDAIREGYQLEDQAATDERRLQQKYGASDAAAFAEGAADTVTLGGYSALAPKLGLTTEEAIRERKERNSLGHTLGTVAGFFVPNPVGAAGTAAKGAAEAAGAGRLVSSALAGGAEMGAYAFGRTNQEAALSRDPMNAESYVANLWHNLKEDVPGGLLLGAGGDLLTRGASKALEETRAVTSAAKKSAVELREASDAVASMAKNREAYEAVAGRAMATPKPKTLFERAGIKAAEEAAPIAKGGTVAAEEAASVIAQAEAAGLKLPRSAAKLPEISRANAYRSLAEDALTKLESASARKAQAVATVGEAGSRLLVGTAVHATLGVPGLVANWALGTGTVLQPAIERYLNKLVSKGTEGLSKAKTAMTGLGKADALVGGLQAAKGKLPFAAGIAERAAQVPWGHVARDAAGHGGELNTGTAGVTGNLLADAAARQPGKVAESRGKLSERIAKGAKSFVTSAKSGKASIPSPAAAFSQNVLGAEDGARGKAGELFKRRFSEVTSYTASPDAGREKLHKSLAALWMADPHLADQVEETAWRKLEYLATIAPKNPGVGSKFDGFRDFAPSDEQMDAFSRQYEVANNPDVVFRDLAAGTLMPDQVDTLKAIYPATYADIVSTIARAVPELQEELSWEQQVSLSTLFTVPVNSLMEPDAIKLLQEQYVPIDEVAATGAAPTSGAPGVVANPEPTSAQRMASR